MSPLAFETIADEQEFRSFEAEWRDLLGRVRRRTYFQSFDWIWRSWEHVARVRGQKLFVVVGRRAGKVVLIWPLVRFRKLLLRRAEWIGGEKSYLQDVLVEDAPEAGEWLEAAWTYATKTLDFMWLNHMNDDTMLGPLLQRIKGVASNVDEAPYVDWADWSDWETYWRARSKNIRKGLGRRRRRLEEQGDVEFRFVTSREERGEVLEWMFLHKAAWMKSKGLRMEDGGIDTADTRDLYRAFVADPPDADGLRLYTLTLDRTVLAAELGFLFEGTLVGVVGVFDLLWEKYTPGSLLTADVLRWTLENDCAIFDFMPIGEDYKYSWAPREAKVTTYVVPCSLPGRILVAWRRSRFGALMRHLVRLRPADLPRLIRKRFSGRSPKR